MRALGAFGIAVAVLGVMILAGVAWFGFQWITAGPSGQLQARQQILSGDNRIQAYNRFFDLCAAVQTSDTALNASYDDLKTASGSDKERIQTNITGQLITRADAVNQYNADSQKSYTVGQFKSSRLPYTLTPYKKGTVISCTA